MAMFNVNDGEPKKEMINLAKDIIEDGLNSFEMLISSLLSLTVQKMQM